LAFLVGGIWWQLPKEGTPMTVQSVMGVLMYTMMNQFMATGTGIAQTIPFLMPAVLREHFAGLYSMNMWYLAKIAADMPFEVAFPIFFGVVTFFLIGWHQWYEADEMVLVFLIHCGILCVITQVANAWGYFTASISRSPEMAFAWFASTLFPWLFYSGFMLPYDDIPAYWIWVMWTSPFKYIYTALVVNIFNYAGDMPCPPGEPCPYFNGDQVLLQFDMRREDGVLAVIVLGVAWVLIRIGGFVGYTRMAVRAQNAQRAAKSKLEKQEKKVAWTNGANGQSTPKEAEKSSAEPAGAHGASAEPELEYC
jgi:hypothetical protein